MKDIEEAIIAQKARCTAKQLKQYKDAKEKVDKVGTFLIRKAKVDIRGCPKWKRCEREGDEECEGGDEECKPAYTNRLITCLVSKEQVETARIQLLTPQGFKEHQM